MHSIDCRTWLVASLACALATSACISDTDCGVCDPEHLVLESISGINYANRKVHLLTDQVERGRYFVDDIGACIETQDAIDAPRGPDEWCKISPLVSLDGLEFVFNNLLDPTTVELIRKDPSNPQLYEVYDWKAELAQLRGPITRYNGDYRAGSNQAPDRMTRAINLSCVDNLRERGIAFNHELLDAEPDICLGFHEVDGRKLPLKLQVDGTTKSFRGATDWRVNDCTAPPSGPDTCCTICDYELSVNVAKYGLDDAGARRTPDSAISCDPSGDVYRDCAGFIVDVNRDDEQNRYSYEWQGSIETFRLPLSDKLRETHPDLRPFGAEPIGAACQADSECDELLGSDAGAACIGHDAGGQACAAGTSDCVETRCQAEWFVGCKHDPNLGGAYCVDRRFKDKGAGACMIATAPFQACGPDQQCASLPAGHRLAQCEVAEYPTGLLAAEQCCQTALGADVDGAGCDPLFQPNLVPVSRFDRDRSLPTHARDCFCGDPINQHPDCAAQIERFCTAPWGTLERHDGSDNTGDYVTRFVTRRGGVVYDPALKGIQFLPADLGGQPRSMVETCAAQSNVPDLIGGRNVQDGWRMHDDGGFETYENFDRGLCSASTYEVVFAEGANAVRDKVGNQLDTRTYTFHTAEFQVVPGSGFPSDNLRIGSCDSFSLDVSNKYDLDPRNLAKLEIWSLERVAGTDDVGQDCELSPAPECWTPHRRLAGGPGCTEDAMLVSDMSPPCLTVDVSEQAQGTITVAIDAVRFGATLLSVEANETGELDEPISGRYRLVVPGLDHVAHFSELDLDDPADVAAYQRAFHDVCGMPLITAGGRGYRDHVYDFSVDVPKCKEDIDGDGIPLSCDNARDYPNTDQDDSDFDGYGDIADLCPLVPSASNTADSDRDGVGNDCDSCREQASKYNVPGVLADNPRLWVRSNPWQLDFDHDGVGDVCDNCVTVPNCASTNTCQADLDADMIGDVCFDPDTNAPVFDMLHAAAPVGLLDEHDFDQDGIINREDYCPRQPLAASYDDRSPCTSDADCPDSTCAEMPAYDGQQYCNHRDTDDDRIGDMCDTCPQQGNAMQLFEGGMQLDDPDGDFIGNDCEASSDCEQRSDARPFAFMPVAVDGRCCTLMIPPDGAWVNGACEGLCDPDGFPIRRDCPIDAVPGEDVPGPNTCRVLPPAVVELHGMGTLPPGCAEALELAGLCVPSEANGYSCPEAELNRRMTLDDVGGDEHELWSHMCFLPQWDQDFDGIGDRCDLCPFAFDPYNEAFVDPNTQKTYPDVGRFCAGAYAPDALCAEQDDEPGETGDESTSG